MDSYDKVVRNLLVVWILTGVWHGAEWTFIVWGFFNFLLVVAEKNVEFEELNISNVIKHIYTLFFINLNWVIFRAANLREAGNYIACMFGFRSTGFWSDYTYMFLKEYAVYFIAAAIFSIPVARKMNKFLIDNINSKPYYIIIEGAYPLAVLLLFMICSSYLVKGTYNPFIYFNF